MRIVVHQGYPGTILRGQRDFLAEIRPDRGPWNGRRTAEGLEYRARERIRTPETVEGDARP